MDQISKRQDVIALDGGDFLVQKAQTASMAEQDGAIVAMVSTASVDSYGDIIVQGRSEKGAGWLLDRFNGAPVMLWSHDIAQPNISGPGTRAVVRKSEQFGEALFLDPVQFDLADPQAAAIEGKIRRGVIKENSVGFVSRKSEYIRDDDDRITGIRFYEQELLELSWANRGANPDTTTMFKTMLAAHPTIAERVLVEDDKAAEWAKADMMATIEALTERVRSLEGLAMQQEVELRHLYDTVHAESVVKAKAEQAAAVDELLRKLGKQ